MHVYRNFIAACVLCSFSLVSFASAASPHPNIVYILADDLGYGDVSCYNAQSKIQTPHVDRLAAEGVRFTDAHTPSAVCTPTRYGILTGRYAWRTRLKYRVLDGLDPPLIDADQLTVPQLLQQHGYHTACVGKWHLGMQWTDTDGNPVPAVSIERKSPPRSGSDVDYTRAITGGPTDRGFDRYFGISASLNMSPFCFIENDRPVRLPTLHQPKIATEFISVDEGVRSPDFTIAAVMPRLAGEAVDYLEQRSKQNPRQPFFLYAPLTSPHLPVIPNVEYLGSSSAGHYGDFVVETDAFVGAVLDALDRTGQADNTIVIFTSDNGGLYHYWQPQESDDVKHYQSSARGKYVQQFGHQGNAHLRGTKADIWEGGHRVPFVVRWPGKTPAGTTSDQLIELTDLMATCAGILGVDLPDGAGPDSRNALPAILGNGDTPVRDFAVHHSLWGEFAIRRGPWKLILHRGSGGFTRPRTIDPSQEGGPPGQLYNLTDDPSETHNVWTSHPETVHELTSLLESIRSE